MATGCGQVTTAAKSFKNELYVDFPEAAGRDTDLVACRVEDEGSTNTHHRKQFVSGLSCHYAVNRLGALNNRMHLFIENSVANQFTSPEVVIEVVLEKMLDDFDYRFTDEMRSNLIALNHRLTEWMEDEGYEQEYIDEHQLSLRELVTVASLIEEETANTLESYTISSVIYNRLYRWGDNPSFLNIDAAIIYALGEHKEELTVSDLQIDSPYNTYTNTGLTPGPITNPGLYSLNAALDPDDTDYYYYAMDPDTGVHHFSEDEDAHNEFLDSLEDE